MVISAYMCRPYTLYTNSSLHMSVLYLILYNKSRGPIPVIHYHYHLNCMDIVIIDTVTLRKEQRDGKNKKFVENKYANRK